MLWTERKDWEEIEKSGGMRYEKETEVVKKAAPSDVEPTVDFQLEPAELKKIDDEIEAKFPTPNLLLQLTEQAPSVISTTTTPVSLGRNQQTRKSSTPMRETYSAEVMVAIGPVPYQAPTGFLWIPNGWKLTRTNEQTDEQEKSFEEVFLDKIRLR